MWGSTVNRLILLQPPSFIYEARPPPFHHHSTQHGSRGRSARRGRGGPGDEEGEGEEEGTVAFGCYAAVSLCDCRCVGGG